MLFLNLVCGLIFGVLAIAFYTLGMSAHASGKAGSLLYKHSKKSSSTGAMTKIAGGIGGGVSIAGSLSGSACKALGTLSLMASGMNLTIAMIETLLVVILVITCTSPAVTASTILRTGGDVSTAAAASISRKEIDDNSQGIVATGSQKDVIDYAQSFVGKVPYVWGGSTPSGWDCSGFTMYVFAHFGINLGVHNDAAQANVAKSWGATDDPKNPKPGDLMRVPGHVAIYLGNGMLVEAASPKLGTRVTKVYKDARGPWEYYNIIDHHK